MRLEGLLKEDQMLGRCHLDPFGLIPCPGRGFVFAAGLTLGATDTLALAR